MEKVFDLLWLKNQMKMDLMQILMYPFCTVLFFIFISKLNINQESKLIERKQNYIYFPKFALGFFGGLSLCFMALYTIDIFTPLSLIDNYKTKFTNSR